MAKPRSDGTRELIGIYGSSRAFVPLREDLLNSAAWISLTPIAQVIMADFLRHYGRVSDFDRSSSDFTRPILYTYGLCNVATSKNTFYRAMRMLQHHQFFRPHVSKKRRSGQAQRWQACMLWKTWEPGQAQLRILNDYHDRRAASIEDPSQMKLPFVARLDVLNKAPAVRHQGIEPMQAIIPEVVKEIALKNHLGAVGL